MTRSLFRTIGRSARRVLPWTFALLAVFAVSSCEKVPVGPSLNNITFTPAIDSTAGWHTAQLVTNSSKDASVCCCHVTGIVTNGNSVPTHVVITFAAKDASDAQLGRIVYFVGDLQPGERRPVDASGFLLACAQIHHVNYEMSVTSVGTPIM